MVSVEGRIEALIPSLRRHARGLTGDADQADDLVQDCLERALSRLALWQGKGELRAWLFTVMRNVWYNQLAHRRARPDMTADDSGLDQLSCPPNQTERLAVLNLAEALDRLAPEQREVLLLVAVEGLSYAEVAEVTGAPMGTVMSRLKRGRDRLAILMNGQEPVLRRVK